MITLRGVTKRYGARLVLDSVSTEIRPGEVTLLLGVNGAGKSTLLRSVLGLEGHEGRIEVCGRDPQTSGQDVRAHIGYMPQSGGLHPDLSVRETMEFYRAIRRAPEARVETLLTEAGLAAEGATRVGDLSGGMRQRLGFAVALIADPPILLLDEPTASLDAASRAWISARLRALAAEGRTVLVSTHAGQQLFDGEGRFLTIEDGRLNDPGSAFPESVNPGPRDPGNRFPQGLNPGNDSRDRFRVPAIRPGDVWPVVRKELRDALQNRWLAGFAILLGVLGLAATASGYDSVAGLGLQMFGRTTATLLNLALLLAPLVGVLMGAASIAGERERGTLEHLLAQPLSRTRLLLGKHAGLLIALSIATVAGFLPAGLLIVANSGVGLLPHYALFPTLAVGAAAALAGIGLVISVSSRSAVQAQGAAVAAWFVLALLYDLVLIGSLAISGLAPHWLVAALALNPIDASRVIGVLALEPDLYLLGPAGAFLTEQLGSLGTALLLGAAVSGWIALPVAVAAFRFSGTFRGRQSHETHRSHVGAGRVRAGRDNRLLSRTGG
ncbi:MAG TPA: ATP-binding cassette domain-containing protein [Vicinamibacterales bacterium]|nr:ATP-binding cassette domain-containing protein [Vicinamibacterales bacterium]